MSNAFKEWEYLVDGFNDLIPDGSFKVSDFTNPTLHFSRNFLSIVIDYIDQIGDGILNLPRNNTETYSLSTLIRETNLLLNSISGSRCTIGTLDFLKPGKNIQIAFRLIINCVLQLQDSEQRMHMIAEDLKEEKEAEVMLLQRKQQLKESINKKTVLLEQRKKDLIKAGTAHQAAKETYDAAYRFEAKNLEKITFEENALKYQSEIADGMRKKIVDLKSEFDENVTKISELQRFESLNANITLLNVKSNELTCQLIKLREKHSTQVAHLRELTDITKSYNVCKETIEKAIKKNSVLDVTQVKLDEAFNEKKTALKEIQTKMNELLETRGKLSEKTEVLQTFEMISRDEFNHLKEDLRKLSCQIVKVDAENKILEEKNFANIAEMEKLADLCDEAERRIIKNKNTAEELYTELLLSYRSFCNDTITQLSRRSK